MSEDGNKQKKASKIKEAGKFLFDIPAWIGVSAIRQNSSWLSRLIKQTFAARHFSSDGQSVAFNDAMQRIGVSSEDLPGRARHFLLISLMFLLFSIFSLGYIAYLWSHASWLVIIAAVIVFCLFATRAYFYSFCCFQIRQKRLDCTFKEWLVWLIKGGL